MFAFGVLKLPNIVFVNPFTDLDHISMYNKL